MTGAYVDLITAIRDAITEPGAWGMSDDEADDLAVVIADALDVWLTRHFADAAAPAESVR